MNGKDTAAALKLLAAAFEQAPAIEALKNRVEMGGVLSFDEIDPAAQPFFVALLNRFFPKRPIIVATPGRKIQETFHQDLSTWLSLLNQADASNALFYPDWEILPHESKLPPVDVISDRLDALTKLLLWQDEPTGNAPVVVASASALMLKSFSPAELRQRTRKISVGESLDPLDLIEWLEDQAYEPEAKVTQKGELSLRGGIVDVFPVASPWPVRMEFFGNSVESIRWFDPLTQISREKINEIILTPAGELGILKRRLDGNTANSSQNENQSATSPATLLDFLPPDCIFILSDPDELKKQAAQYREQIPGTHPLLIDWEQFQAGISLKGMTAIELAGAAWPVSEHAVTQSADVLRMESLEAFRPLTEQPPIAQAAEIQRREFFGQLHRWLRQGFLVLVVCNNEGERQRFEELWREMLREHSGQSAVDSQPHLVTGALSRGFNCESAKVVVVTDAEIFGRYRVSRPRRLKTPGAAAAPSALLTDFTELEEGDYVVHVQYGIGRFLGLGQPQSHHEPQRGKQPAGGFGEECLIIEYAPRKGQTTAPRVYVPVSHAHLVSKYVGAGHARPKLNRLGTRQWANTKARAENAVRDLAAELLEIQARRATLPGHAFSPDTPWQREMEAAFIYEVTPDQDRAIRETKQDMEMPKPMDRLICGDVGYGKTEVAIRAAFKAVMDGKQVAVLAPTTVLAHQHYRTFSERMADYPIRLELLSRFRSRHQQALTIAELASGGVDIVIGTHRLLQDDVAFKELGLVIIDEEQRFGVEHKEKLKRLRCLVDVLTLSATPIPRTLYLALAGARDMSTIETPPHDRLPVQTIVSEYDERLIRDAIQRELNRNGQVFYLHNRVYDIDAVASRIQMLVPHARLVVGHGQMKSAQLEEVMTRFINGDADVLVSTTIIESGVDIPNANTIIIDRADRFGLSDLYQLRGRVGRYKHQAYAYLLIPRHAGLLSDARKRISAIKQYSSLGSGFKIAMRDLEIRGAGNLLGREQSGHITAVGFELYCQLLKKSIGALKGETTRPRAEIATRLDFLAMNPGQTTGQPARAPAYLPPQYISEPRLRIEAYRKLADAADSAQLDKLRAEWQDRFGPLPEAACLLLQVAEIKLLAASKNVSLIETEGDKLKLIRNNQYLTLAGRFPRLEKKQPAARLNEIKRLLVSLQ